MRIDLKIFNEIAKELNYETNDVEVGIGFDNEITLRFGYWAQVNIEVLKKYIPKYISVTERLVDDDEDYGPLYNYLIID